MIFKNKLIFQYRDGLNAVPTTSQEKSDCSKVLTPQQLHQVVIGKQFSVASIAHPSYRVIGEKYSGTVFKYIC